MSSYIITSPIESHSMDSDFTDSSEFVSDTDSNESLELGALIRGSNYFVKDTDFDDDDDDDVIPDNEVIRIIIPDTDKDRGSEIVDILKCVLIAHVVIFTLDRVILILISITSIMTTELYRSAKIGLYILGFYVAVSTAFLCVICRMQYKNLRKMVWCCKGPRKM